MKNTVKTQNNAGKKGNNPKARGGKPGNKGRPASTSVVFTPARNRNSDWNTVK